MAETDFDDVRASSLKEGTRDVPSGTQHADITAPTAASALTASAPAAATVGANLGAFSDPPTAGEMAALVTFVNALKADNADLRTKLAAAVVDTANTRTALTSTDAKLNEVRDTLDAFQETA